MVKQLKTFILNLIAGANIAVVVLMLLAGYSDHLSPAQYPWAETLGMVFPVLLLINMAFLIFWIVIKWKKVWIPIVGYVLAYVPISIYMPLNLRSTAPPDSTAGVIKVMSYNVCGYGGNFKYKDAFERIRDYIDAEQPHIVCIQEDFDTWRRYAFLHYGKTYPYNDTVFFSKTSSFPNAVGIHSKYPIVRRERIAYESKNNGSVAYFLQVGSDTVLVVNNHFESTHLNDADRKNYKSIIAGKMESDTMRAESAVLMDKINKAAARRALQAEIVHKYIEEHSNYPVIVCGDFNDSPISYSRHIIAQGLTDCFVAAGNGIGLSYNQKGFFFRIDHVFCSHHFQPLKCEVDAKIDFSDHYPLICWLKMEDNY